MCFQVATCLQGLETVSSQEHPCLSTAFTLHDHDGLYGQTDGSLTVLCFMMVDLLDLHWML